MTIKAVVYSRRACHLCEDLLEVLQPLLRNRAELEVIDIDSDAALRERYNTEIPVLTINGEFVCRYQLDSQALESRLVAAESA